MATFKKILIPYYGSQACKKAAEKAMELAKDQGAELVGLKVVSFSFETIAPSDNLWEAIRDDLQEKAKGMLADLEGMAKERELEIKLEIREGDLETEVVALANEIGADLVVMSLGSRVKRMGSFFGKGQQRISVRTLVAEAPCPVMFIS
jgi:nucleotide-binding universal stress UspA family protein